MNQTFLLFLVLATCFSTLDFPQLLKNSYTLYKLARNEKGVYRDSKLFSGQDYHPCSIAANGVGIMATTIATQTGLISDGEDSIILTLKTMNGKTQGFSADKNVDGFIRHFIDMENGTRYWDSEYSTIDTALFVSGALFAKEAFSTNQELVSEVDELWQSINFETSVKNGTTGEYYMIMQKDGSGDQTSLLKPFNEYIVLCYFAYLKEKEKSVKGEATLLWHNFYSDPTTSKIPKLYYDGIPVLYDDHLGFLSSFVFEFPYYHCPYFRNSSAYMEYLENELNADYQWFMDQELTYWGLGAGVQPDGYSANSINNNDFKMVSPQIVGGGLGIVDRARDTLLKLMDDSSPAIYTLPDEDKSSILWRFSLNETSWRADCVQLIDYSTLMFGLAQLDDICGIDYFKTGKCEPKIAIKKTEK